MSQSEILCACILLDMAGMLNIHTDIKNVGVKKKTYPKDFPKEQLENVYVSMIRPI